LKDYYNIRNKNKRDKIREEKKKGEKRRKKMRKKGLKYERKIENNFKKAGGGNMGGEKVM
jgi:hypothetical protein